MKTLKEKVKGKSKTITPAQKKTLYALGYAIVAAETDTSTVADAYMAVFGKSDQELVLVADALDKRWEEIYAEIKKTAPDVSGKRAIVEMSQRTAYNRRSDDKAWLNACRAYANGETPHKLTAKQFASEVKHAMEAKHSDKRNTLVMLARAYISKRAGKGKGEDKRAQRAASAWKNKPSETFNQLKVMLGHAPLAWCFKLEAFIEQRIKQVKKQPLAEVKHLKAA